MSHTAHCLCHWETDCGHSCDCQRQGYTTRHWPTFMLDCTSVELSSTITLEIQSPQDSDCNTVLEYHVGRCKYHQSEPLEAPIGNW